MYSFKAINKYFSSDSSISMFCWSGVLRCAWDMYFTTKWDWVRGIDFCEISIGDVGEDDVGLAIGIDG